MLLVGFGIFAGLSSLMSGGTSPGNIAAGILGASLAALAVGAIGSIAAFFVGALGGLAFGIVDGILFLLAARALPRPVARDDSLLPPVAGSTADGDAATV